MGARDYFFIWGWISVSVLYYTLRIWSEKEDE